LNLTECSSSVPIPPDPGAGAGRSPRRPVSACRTLLVASCLIAWAGCRDGGSPGEAEAPEGPAGHVIPAHKPKDFPSAVRRLRDLNARVTSKLDEGKARSLVAEKTLPMALDIANWLPEIAADSDMPESPWDQVNDRSTALVAGYQKIMAGAAIDDHPADAPALAIEAGSTIKALETLLDSADARWFDPAKPGVK
jgi:hypothetical protein